MVNSETFVGDTLFWLKSGLSKAITDPISSKRPSNSKFVMTSYPQKEAVYPMFTIKIPNYTATRAGMQTSTMDLEMDVELRLWARNVKERDQLFTSGINVLRSIQFDADGSINNHLHDFNMTSAVEIDEDDTGIKSKVMNFQYKFFNL